MSDKVIAGTVDLSNFEQVPYFEEHHGNKRFLISLQLTNLLIVCNVGCQMNFLNTMSTKIFEVNNLKTYQFIS